MKCSECCYCIPNPMNYSYQCQYWSAMNGKLVEIFKPDKAGCDKGIRKQQETPTEESNKEK